MLFYLFYILISCFYLLDVYATVEYEDHNVVAQVNGNFGDMDRIATQPLGAIQKAWDSYNQQQGVYIIQHCDNEIIKIRMREYMSTTITFPIWENISNIVVADEGVVKAKTIKNNIVILEPQRFVGTDTTITMLGAGNVYVFYIRLESYKSVNIPDISVLIKSHPRKEFDSISMPVKTQDVNEYLSKVIINPEDLNFNFSMSGDKDIAPDFVYSDGQRTWLYYGSKIHNTRLPAVFFVKDGVDMPANTNRIKNSIVVQGVGDLTLKNGLDFVCVYQEN